MTTYAVIRNMAGNTASLEIPESFEDVWDFIANEYPELYDLDIVEMSNEVVGFEIITKQSAIDFAKE